MTRRTPPATLFAVLVVAHLVGGAWLLSACGGPTDAQRLRMTGVHVAAREEPVEAVPPPGAETRLLPQHHAAGDTYRRVDASSIEVGPRITVIRIERILTVESVDSEGIATFSEKITSYDRTVDGRSATPAREERELDAATIRYRMTDLGQPVGELEILGVGRFNELVLRRLGQSSFADDGLDRCTDMAIGERRRGDTTIAGEFENNVRSDMRLHLDYTLAARSEREVRFDLDGTAELSETQIGRYKIRGTGNVTGRYTVDPRNGFASTANLEVRVYVSRRDAGNRPMGPTTTVIFRAQTNITKR